MNKKQRQRLWNKYNVWKALHPQMNNGCKHCRFDKDLSGCLNHQGFKGEFRDKAGKYSCLGFLLEGNYVK